MCAPLLTAQYRLAVGPHPFTLFPFAMKYKISIYLVFFSLQWPKCLFTCSQMRERRIVQYIVNLEWNKGRFFTYVQHLYVFWGMNRKSIFDRIICCIKNVPCRVIYLWYLYTLTLHISVITEIVLFSQLANVYETSHRFYIFVCSVVSHKCFSNQQNRIPIRYAFLRCKFYWCEYEKDFSRPMTQSAWHRNWNWCSDAYIIHTPFANRYIPFNQLQHTMENKQWGLYEWIAASKTK